MDNSKQNDFIPARESSFIISFFKWYTWYLMKRRFSSVYVRNGHKIDRDKSTLYICNHHYWWDGLTPLVLNEFIFHHRARAVMEDKQMREFPFFSKIGAFSINRNNPKSALSSLKYGADWLNVPNTCLFLYPEGKFSQPHVPIQIESGVTKLLEWVPSCQMVNISMYISYQKRDRPDFFIDISSEIEHPKNESKSEIVTEINSIMNSNLSKLRIDSQSSLDSFVKLF